VCLGFNIIENIEPLKHLARVRELDLQRNRILSIPKGTLSCLFNLQRLNVSFNYLTEFSSELCTLEALRELNLSNNKIFEIKEGKCVKMCGLEVLNLASNNFEAVEFLQGITDLKSLRNLNLLSTPLFVMKQKEEKENIKQAIIGMAKSLKILNCEELHSNPTSKDKIPGKLYLGLYGC
jgi:Leucine-rich repeat (LRR) protein